MAAGRHFKNINRHNSAALQDIFTKFGTEIDTAQPRRALSSNVTCDKIQDGGSRHFEKNSQFTLTAITQSLLLVFTHNLAEEEKPTSRKQKFFLFSLF